jgi:hypothetical protein
MLNLKKMAIPSRQIGWGTEDNLLWQISKQLQYLTQVTSTSISSFISQTITSGVTDKAPSENAVYNALSAKQGFGKIKLTDPDGAQFSDFPSARAYVQSFTSATIFDESFNVNGNEYFFSVAANTLFNNTDSFCNDTNMNFQDPYGLVITFGDDCFDANVTDNIFGNIDVNDGFLKGSQGNNIIGNVTCRTEFLRYASGNNIIGNVSSSTYDHFLSYSTGNNTIGNVTTYDYFLYQSTGNNIIGNIVVNDNCLTESKGNNTIGNVDANEYFLTNSEGNNIIGDITTENYCLKSSIGNNTMNNVVAQTEFLTDSSGNNTINGEINVGDDAFKNATPSIRNSIYKIYRCAFNFAYQYTGRMDVYVWGDTLGQDLPTDIFTTTNLVWINTTWYYNINLDLDVAQAQTNLSGGNIDSAIIYNL